MMKNKICLICIMDYINLITLSHCSLDKESPPSYNSVHIYIHIGTISSCVNFNNTAVCDISVNDIQVVDDNCLHNQDAVITLDEMYELDGKHFTNYHKELVEKEGKDSRDVESDSREGKLFELFPEYDFSCLDFS